MGSRRRVRSTIAHWEHWIVISMNSGSSYILQLLMKRSSRSCIDEVICEWSRRTRLQGSSQLPWSKNVRTTQRATERRRKGTETWAEEMRMKRRSLWNRLKGEARHPRGHWDRHSHLHWRHCTHHSWKSRGRHSYTTRMRSSTTRRSRGVLLIQVRSRSIDALISRRVRRHVTLWLIHSPLGLLRS